MKKLLFLAAALSAACAASAQGYYTDAYNPDITRHTGRIAAQRAEFILPEVNGYNVYKADLHTHSVYSDGDCTPEFRVREAWYDGLDVLAITEHVEYRRHEGLQTGHGAGGGGDVGVVGEVQNRAQGRQGGADDEGG